MSRVDHLLALLHMDPDWRDPNPGRDQVTAMQHALQCATRAERHDRSDAQMIVAALLHDAARPLSDVRHGEVIAEALADRVRLHVTQALRHHGAYQSAWIHGGPTGFEDEPWHPVAVRLAAWDSASFDPRFPTYPLEHFVPFMHAVLDD